MKYNLLKSGLLLLPVLFLAQSFIEQNKGDNKLSRSQKKEGWQLLFNGRNLNGWRTYQNKASNSWSVKDGSLYCKPVISKGEIRSDLISKEMYENFDLSVDWKISDKGNSGILYMVTEDYKTSYLSGPEYQIIDDINYPEKLEPWQKTGSNYAMNPAPAADIKPAGTWNHTEIIVNNLHVQHWLNNKKIVEYDLYNDEWKKNKMEGKWKDAPGYGMSKRGHIALQDHGSEAWFKNIIIKQL
ncbi:MAG: DUF1080 domain-containing protein [Ginsengibacter sp.]